MEMTGFLRYELERSGGMYTGGQQPPSSEFITIFSTSNQLSYLDQQIPWIEELFFDNLIQYRVCAVYSDGRKEYSNIEKITTSKYHFKQAAIINSNNAELNVIQAYPNPFNPTCKINYNINTSGLAKLVLFNSLGQEIQILENGNLECGLHETIVNGTKLSSGIYFLQLKQETGISTIKLLLEK